MKLNTAETSQTLNINTLASVFEHLPNAFVIASVERKVLNMNKATEALFGYRNDELLQHSTEVFYANKSIFSEQGEKRYNPELKLSNKVSFVEYKTKSGQLFLGNTSSGHIKDKAGNVLFFVASVTDESERLKAEESLAKLHEITSSRDLNFKERVDAILQLGSQQFNLPIAIFSKIVGDNYIVKQAIHPENALEKGMTFPLGDTYCDHVYQANDVQGFSHVSESEISLHPCFINFGLEAYIGAPIFADGVRYGTLNFSSPDPTRPYIKQDIELVRLFATWIGHEIARNNDVNALKEAHRQLEVLASTDMLTDIANRRSIDETLEKTLSTSNRHNLIMSVAVFDFDHFKDINDTYGHHVGDKALKLFGQLVNEMSRTGDFYGRWGGDEFLAIFPLTAPQGAQKFIERLSKRLKEFPLTEQGISIPITLSVGITQRINNDNAELIIQRADELLYKAKQNGRDRIEIDT
ncbi:diguanylate cyclase [Psychromonas sp. KJ10-10]|uniref:diguanylate cyclase n=1 Tax=Psychromonas sp. KJ10-10 TaxID=3391823 RepID=UPI0039B5F19D